MTYVFYGPIFYVCFCLFIPFFMLCNFQIWVGVFFKLFKNEKELTGESLKYEKIGNTKHLLIFFRKSFRLKLKFRITNNIKQK